MNDSAYVCADASLTSRKRSHSTNSRKKLSPASSAPGIFVADGDDSSLTIPAAFELELELVLALNLETEESPTLGLASTVTEASAGI